jgi:O-antigen/teichoic acid export membrane protein
MRLAAGNLAFNLLGLLTGLILARALGPEGRGTLAAILVPVAIAPYVAGVGLSSFALRTSARGERPGVLIPTLALLALLIGLVLLPVLPWIVSLFAEGRDVVETYLLAGLIALPLFIMAPVQVGVVTGLERWNLVVSTRVLQPLAALIWLLTLWVTGNLTVASAAIAVLASALIVLIPTLTVLRGEGRPRIDLGLARRALGFGVRAWPGTLSQIANARLDQLLMVPLVPPRQLGLYVLAYTVSTGPSILGTAISSAIQPRVARGEYPMVAAGSRIVLPTVALAGALIAIACPTLLPLIFGSAFEGATPLAWILLAAAVPGQVALFLGEALSAGGRPGLATAGQLIALAVTVPGLLLLLGPLGAYGAAIVSCAAYAAYFAFALYAAHRHFGGRVLDYLVPRAADVSLLWRSLLRREA